MMSTPLESAITENAAGPKRARGDSGEVEQHPLSELIAADRYLAQRAATTAGKTKLPLRFAKLNPDGTV